MYYAFNLYIYNCNGGNYINLIIKLFGQLGLIYPQKIFIESETTCSRLK